MSKALSSKVLWNPFNDIVVRDLSLLPSSGQHITCANIIIIIFLITIIIISIKIIIVVVIIPSQPYSSSSPSGQAFDDPSKQQQAVKMVNRKATKDKKLLSFAVDEEEDGGGGDEQKSGSSSRSDRDGVVVKLRMHSSHDSKYKDKKLSSKVPKMSMKCLKPYHLCWWNVYNPIIYVDEMSETLS